MEYGAEKLCGRCGETKPINDFRLSKAGYRNSYCIPCTREYARERWVTHPDRMREISKRGHLKQLETNPDYRVKRNERVKRWTANNPERATELRRKYEQENPAAIAAKNARRTSKRQRETLEVAERHGAEWTGVELEMIADKSRTTRELALTLGRSYYAVATMRVKLRNNPAVIERAGLIRHPL